MAPGEKVTLPKVGGGYRLGSGTSFASPHAAGAAALLKGKDASMTPDDIMGTLKGGARQPVEYNDHEYGAGIIDLYETLVGA
jgi:subtilisin family serine protease